MLAALSAVAAMSVNCAPIAGASLVLSRTEIQWVFLGESRHGTNEMPKAALDFICEAIAAGRTVSVALEHRAGDQQLLDRYLLSDGGAKARADLLAGGQWVPAWADGKSSEAMLRLIDHLRTLYQARRLVRVVLFDADSISGASDRDRQMARALRAIDVGDDGLIVVLTGGLHAKKRAVPAIESGYVPAAAMLPRSKTISLVMSDNGGAAWNCTDNGCGVNDDGLRRSALRRITVSRKVQATYDGVFELGTRVTPSPPANHR